jgi:hypothetical protein
MLVDLLLGKGKEPYSYSLAKNALLYNVYKKAQPEY